MVKGLSYEEAMGLQPSANKGLSYEEAIGAPTESQGNVAAGLVGKVGQGATFGLADEMQAGLFALPRYIGNEIRGQENASLGSAYDELLQSQRGNLQAAQEQYPVASGVAEIAGGLGTLGGIGAGTKLGRTVYSAGTKGLAPAAVTKLGKAANLVSKVGIGAGTGAATTGAYGFGTGEGGAGNRLDEAQGSAVLGATVGAGIPLATSGVGAVGLALTPKIDEGFKEVGKLARKYNIPLSLDQLTSSKTLKNVQKVSQEVPLSGQSAFRDKQLSAWNKAVTKSFGAESDRITPEVIDSAYKRLGKQFELLGKGKTASVNNIIGRTEAIKAEAVKSGASEDALKGFDIFLQKELVDNADAAGNIKGETLNRIRARANELARKTNNLDSQTLYHDLENEIVENLLPNKAGKKAFQQTKFQYKNLLAVTPLIKNEVAGNIKPTALVDRVAKIYNNQFYRGKAGELGDLARIGKQLLPELGGSDTVQKAAYLAAATGGIANPASIPLIATGVGANRAFQSFFNRNQGLIDKLLRNDKTAQKELMKLKPSEINAVKKAVKEMRVEPTINLKNTKK